MSWRHFYGTKISTSEKSVLEQASGRAVEGEAHSGAGLLAGLGALWGTHTRAPVLQDCILWEGHMLAVPEVGPVGRSQAGGVPGGLSPVGGTPASAILCSGVF